MYIDMQTELERLLARIVVTEAGCWEWQGAKTGAGYGAQRFRGRMELTHRISYILHIGPIPVGLHLDHLCRNTICCNPADLEAVTPKVNTQRQPRVADRTHCPQGHEIAGENVYVLPAAGNLACRPCRLEASRRRHERERIQTGRARRDPTQCRRGHAFDEANTYITTDGRRNCRACRAAAVTRYQQKKGE